MLKHKLTRDRSKTLEERNSHERSAESIEIDLKALYLQMRVK